MLICHRTFFATGNHDSVGAVVLKRPQLIYRIRCPSDLGGFIVVRQKIVDPGKQLFDTVKSIVERENLQALGIKCFDLLELTNTTGCVAVSLLNDSGIPAGCEADIPATITMLILQTLTNTPSFMGNLCSISEDKILLAHCTVATRLVKSYILRNHFESGMGVSIQGALFHGPVTLAKIDPEFQKMVLAEGDITGSGLNYPGLCRTQVEVTLNNARELLEKAVGNHLIVSPGKHKQILKEFCSYYGLDVVEI